jgi:glycosyltransferase involved in cell wall biosynthesis
VTAHRGQPAASAVMQVALSLSPGGTERLVIEISRRLAQRRPVVVCCLDEPGTWADELTRAGIEVLALSRRPGFRPSLSVRLARLARARGIGVLHCHHYSPFVYGGLAALLARGLRVVYTKHGRLSDAPPTRKRLWVNPWLDRLPATVCAVSEDLKRHMMASGFSGQRIRVVYNGIESGTTPTDGDRRRARAALGMEPSSFVVGTIARLDPVKDLMTLINGFETLAAGHDAARLVIVGDGPERPALEARARATGLGARIHFAGHRDDARALLAGFDLFVNCSTTEGVSLTILEAMAAAVPVVATRVGGTPEVVIDGCTGILAPARDARALAGAMSTLAAAAGRRSALGAAGRARVEQHFTLDRMVGDYERLYGGTEPS